MKKIEREETVKMAQRETERMVGENEVLTVTAALEHKCKVFLDKCVYVSTFLVITFFENSERSRQPTNSTDRSRY